MTWLLLALLVLSNGFWLLALAGLAHQQRTLGAELDQARRDLNTAQAALMGCYQALALSVGHRQRGH